MFTAMAQQASYKGLPCIRPANLENLYGWLKLRRFVAQWSDRRQLDNSEFAVGSLICIAFALGMATWFIVVGKPLTSSKVGLHCGAASCCLGVDNNCSCSVTASRGREDVV